MIEKEKTDLVVFKITLVLVIRELLYCIPTKTTPFGH
jgi:hypothetical protein